MATEQAVASASALLKNDPKCCVKCKQKTRGVSLACVMCTDVYHKGCLQTYVTRGKKIDFINESEMVCFKHSPTHDPDGDETPEVPEDTELVRQLNDLKMENAMQNGTEISKLKEKLNGIELNKKADTESSSTLLDIVKTFISEVKTDMADNFLNLKKEVLDINRRFDELKVNGNTGCSRTLQDRTSYSDALKKSDVIIVQPKVNQHSSETLDSLHQTINPVEEKIGISKVKRLKNGGVAISCSTKEDVDKLQNLTETRLGEDFKISKPKRDNPKIKIIGISENLDEDQLKNCILKQNSSIESVASWKLNVIKKMKNRFMAIFEVDAVSFETVMELGFLNIQWDFCRVFEHVNLLRCFKCGGFNHTSSYCRGQQVCLKCEDLDHNEKDCTNSPKCMNCSRLKRNGHLNLSTDHSCFDRSCATLQKQTQWAKQFVNYSTE